MYKPKYKKGSVIGTMNALLYFLEKNNFVYVRNHIEHRNWVRNYRFNYIIGCIKGGCIKRAIKIDS